MIKEMYADLIEAAKEAYQNAYVPYSKFPVGAALKLTDGTIINGANIENASFGLTNFIYSLYKRLSSRRY